MSEPKRFALIGIVLIAVVATAALAAPPGMPQAAQDEFVPIDQLPPQDQLPAAPLLIAAYGFVWVAVLGYLWSVWKRLGSVEQQLQEVDRRLSRHQE